MRRHLPVVRRNLPRHGCLKEKPMLEEEKLKEAIVDELKRQAANRPQSLKVEVSSEELILNGKIDLADLVMVIAGSVAGGP
ncbi:BON domain-containing protein [Bradyrhizobium japonicum]|uniref:BON domain-containing protein n=2 Tax=Nitrobacteraceae TaxID=41294 RepID=UPI0004B6A5AE|nr:BON domain-containing protein [Bradyrhizobium japonicum]